MVVGPWGECSKDMHSLIKVMGETKVAAQARARGRPASDNELGVVISQIRKFLSTAFIRAQQALLPWTGSKGSSWERRPCKETGNFLGKEISRLTTRPTFEALVWPYVCALGDTNL
jgi:hypothetical protein